MTASLLHTTLLRDHALHDPLLRDARLSSKILGLAGVLLLLGAAAGINTWPGQDLVEALLSGSATRIFMALTGYGLVFSIIFWGAQPSPSAQRAVCIGWVVTSFAVWQGLGEDLNVGLFDAGRFPVEMFLATTLAIPAMLALAWRCLSPAPPAPALLEARLRTLLLVTVLFFLAPPSALTLTANMHPFTFDFQAIQFERAAGLILAPALVEFVDAIPGLSHLIRNAYGLTPLAFLAVALLQLKGRPVHLASALLVWVGMSLCATLAYHVYPITGPLYVFGSADFVKQLSHPETLPTTLALVAPYPRNGMPSMHFGWMLAASILWWQSGTRPFSRLLFAGATLCTALATIYLGEHYLIDLVVAVPFVLASLALCTTGIAWSGSDRLAVALAGFATWLLWVLLLRTQVAWLSEHPWACQAMLLATALVALWQARRMAGFKNAARAALPAARPADTSALGRKFGAMFFVSGAAALIYQILFAKQLALVFGSTATATFTVLATFLGGMAIGSLIGGFVAERVRRPLIVYAGIEMGIAIYCVITPILFQGIQDYYVYLAKGMPPDTPALLALRVLLGAAVLAFPTILMGTTLPILTRALGQHAGSIGTRVAWLYFTNTAGAALGALLTAYFIIPAVGAKSTALIAAAANLMIALAALELAKNALDMRREPTEVTRPGAAPATQAVNRATWMAALAALGFGGVLSLGLEVVYVHMLSIVAGNSVYAFGLMVATFLIGLSLGGEAGRRILLSRRLDSASALAFSLLGIAISVTLGSLLWNSIPDYFASFANYPAAKTFAAREAIRGIVCSLAMIPPTLFIGAAYTFAMDLVTAYAGKPKLILLGTGAAANTLGNICGVLLFGFVLLPSLGGLGASRVIAGSALLLAGMVVWLAARAHYRRIAPVALATLLLIAGTGKVELDYGKLSSGANVYFFPQNWGNIVDHAESIDGGLTTVTRNPLDEQTMVNTLLTNGKFQGNDALTGEMRAQVGFAFAPLLHTEKRDRALVIGYGTGVTSRVFHEAGFATLEIAELSGDVVALADRHFGGINHLVSQQANTRTHITDGRNLLLLSEHRFDVISIEITSIWFAGAASLYNQEFYQLAKQRLNPEGVLQQWVQLHRLSPLDLLYVMSSLRMEFEFVSLYVFGSQGILVATNDSTRQAAYPPALAKLAATPQLAEARSIAGASLESLSDNLLLSPQGVDQFINRYGLAPQYFVSTDNNLRLEYSTPRANVNDATRSYAENLALLSEFKAAGTPPPER